MRSDSPIEAASAKQDKIRDAARKALADLLDPLLGFVFDSGLSVQELNSILREVAVRNFASRQKNSTRRVSMSGIAASTGIPRAEISRILKSSSQKRREPRDYREQATNRILSAWHQDPKFISENGRPCELKIYGRGTSFDSLVKTYGRSIPTRALLDELLSIGAVELLASGRVRAKTSVAIERGASYSAVRSLGERVTELLSTMLSNMRDPGNARFIASVSNANITESVLPLIRKEIAQRGANLLAEIQDLLDREPPINDSVSKSRRVKTVSVTIFCHEIPGKYHSGELTDPKRRNFRREL